MDLVTFRQFFAEQSGRFDLVTDAAAGDWTDDGADKIILAGQNFLDEKAETYKKLSRLFYELSAGTWYKTFTKNRSIIEVWINDSSSRWSLKKKDFEWLKEEYSGLISETDTGDPLYYCPARLRSEASADMDAQGSFFNYVLTSHEEYRGVLIFPPPEDSVVLEVQGYFYTPWPSTDDGTNYWLTNYFDALLLASLYMIEVLLHRNTQGARDHLVALDERLAELDKDTVEEEIAEFNQISG